MKSHRKWEWSWLVVVLFGLMGYAVSICLPFAANGELTPSSRLLIGLIGPTQEHAAGALSALAFQENIESAKGKRWPWCASFVSALYKNDIVQFLWGRITVR